VRSYFLMPPAAITLRKYALVSLAACKTLASKPEPVPGRGPGERVG
jgi:hypothetical protein